MAKKIIVVVTGLVLFLGVAFAAEKVTSTTTTAKLSDVAVFAAEKTKEKAEAAKPEQTKVCPMQKQKQGLIDQLIKAYKADDKKAMDEIIVKLEKRQKQMKKFAQFEKWHKMAHRKMSMHRGQGHRQGWQQGRCGGCPGMQMNRNWGPPAGGFRSMPQWRNPGRCAPTPQMKGCPLGPNQQTEPSAEKPGAWWNDNEQTPDLDEITAIDNEELFAAPDNEVAFNDDFPADSEW